MDQVDKLIVWAFDIVFELVLDIQSAKLEIASR